MTVGGFSKFVIFIVFLIEEKLLKLKENILI